MDIVDQIGKVATDTKGPMQDVPVTPIVIKGMTVKR
jgi:hypothetical protein